MKKREREKKIKVVTLLYSNLLQHFCFSLWYHRFPPPSHQSEKLENTSCRNVKVCVHTHMHTHTYAHTCLPFWKHHRKTLGLIWVPRVREVEKQALYRAVSVSVLFCFFPSSPIPVSKNSGWEPEKMDYVWLSYTDRKTQICPQGPPKKAWVKHHTFGWDPKGLLLPHSKNRNSPAQLKAQAQAT
jgi:hypothetical protein